ncbi:MAG: hypothetical protein HYT79_07100 [Elusimicrobia bacterium]|nr:hypothetical protein [Elusimicrobiota bacterium]
MKKTKMIATNAAALVFAWAMGLQAGSEPHPICEIPASKVSSVAASDSKEEVIKALGKVVKTWDGKIGKPTKKTHAVKTKPIEPKKDDCAEKRTAPKVRALKWRISDIEYDIADAESSLSRARSYFEGKKIEYRVRCVGKDPGMINISMCRYLADAEFRGFQEVLDAEDRLSSLKSEELIATLRLDRLLGACKE